MLDSPFRRYFRALEQVVTLKHGLTLTELTILEMIFESSSQGVRLPNMTRVMQVTKPTVSRIVAIFVERGYVTRHVSEMNKKHVTFRITLKGAAIYSAYRIALLEDLPPVDPVPR